MVPLSVALAAAADPASFADAVEVAEVALSPDGAVLAFVTDASGDPELWTLDLVAPGAAPVQRTRLAESVYGLAWRPGSRELWFCVDRGGDGVSDLWTWDGAAHRQTRTRQSEDEPAFSPDGRQLAVSVDLDAPFTYDLALWDGRPVRLTAEAANVSGAVWRDDGAELLAAATPDEQRGDLLKIDPRSGAVTRVAPPVADGIAWPVGYLDGAPVVNATNPAGFSQLAALTTSGWTWLGPGGSDVEHAHVDAAGVVWTRNVGGSELLVGDRTLLTGGVIDSLSVVGDAIAVARSASGASSEVLLVGRRSGEVRVLVPATRRGPPADHLILPGPLAIDAWVNSPDRPWPAAAVVLLHGGPSGEARDAWDAQVAALADAGFLVVRPNYRGSTGRGRAFEDLNNRDWGGGDVDDIIAVVDALAERGELDPARVGVMGGSFGGYLTLAAITRYPDRFAAAVDMYGMADLVADYELTRDRYGTWYETEMGTPQSEPALFHARSPIFALGRVTAPVLVLQGRNDTDVPRAESDAVVRALGGHVRYVLYPREGHGFVRRATRRDALRRTVSFFLEHLRP